MKKAARQKTKNWERQCGPCPVLFPVSAAPLCMWRSDEAECRRPMETAGGWRQQEHELFVLADAEWQTRTSSAAAATVNHHHHHHQSCQSSLSAAATAEAKLSIITIIIIFTIIITKVVNNQHQQQQSCQIVTISSPSLSDDGIIALLLQLPFSSAYANWISEQH